ncbi:MAG: hypothetical protein H0W09_02660 [Solirubrobacterales bacterium]|nr:hypothetical protein [Solirubrobacterales bacterium]
MQYLDDRDDGQGAAGRRPSGDHQRQILLRRLLALGVGVVIVVLLAVGVNSCLDARAERGFETYVSELEEIVDESNQLSESFFERLTDPPPDLDEVSLKPQVASDRGTAENELTRVEALDPPDELADAQLVLEQAFTLRRDALADIAERIADAVGSENRDEALEALVSDMETLLASDVLYERARGEILAVLEEQGLAGDLPQSEFLPPDSVEQYLDAAGLASLLSGIGGETAAGGGLHGLGLLQVSINPSGSALSGDGLNTIPLEGGETIVAQVQNQGDSTEQEVGVTYELSGASGTSEGEATIASIEAGETLDVEIPLSAEPATGEELTLTVMAVPVEGEEVEDNNELSFPIVFE